MLKIAKKWPNFALSGQFWLQSDFFRKSPIRLRPRRGPTGTEHFESAPPPPSKIWRKNPDQVVRWYFPDRLLKVLVELLDFSFLLFLC